MLARVAATLVAAHLAGQVTNAFRTRADQAALAGAPEGFPVAKSSSGHEAGLAVDLNSRASNFCAIVSAMENAGFSWGGAWPGAPDRVHFYIGPVRPSSAQIAPVQDYSDDCLQ